MKAAEKLVRDAIRAEPKRVQITAVELLERATRASQVVVRVHPLDVPLIEELKAQGQTFGISSDESLERGECVVESNLGELDARFSVQLAALEKALADDEP